MRYKFATPRSLNFKKFLICIKKKVQWQYTLPSYQVLVPLQDEDDFLPEEPSPTVEPQSLSLGKTPTDFLHFGVSPGFKHIQDIT